MGTLVKLPGTFCELCGTSYTDSSWGRQSLTFGFCCVRCVNKASRVVRRHNRRAKASGSKGTLFPFDWLATVYSHGYCCASCGLQKDLTLDHRRPLSKGGHNLAYNIQPLCQDCHRLKDNIPSRETLAGLSQGK